MREKILKRQLASDDDKLINAKVTIFGCGGLGSNIAMMLARAGVGTIYLFDFDKVEYSNLNRQNYILKDLGKNKAQALKEHILEAIPFIEVKDFNVKLDEDNIFDYLNLSNIYIEAFDDEQAKTLLFDVFAKKPDKHLISASGVSGIDHDLIKIKKISNIEIIGDFISQQSQGLYSPKVNLVASIQALQALKLILKGDV